MIPLEPNWADPHFWLFLSVVALAVTFDYINGFHDAANAIATVVATKVLSPRTAVLFGAVLNTVGAFLGTEVAATVGKGFVSQTALSLETLLFALIGATAWNLFTWWKGLPSSSSHALIGSLLGATFFSVLGHARGDEIQWGNILQKLVIPMFTSPVVGFVVGYAVMALLSWAVYRLSLRFINGTFGKLQLISSGLMALEHGRNDAQKTMGIIALAVAIYTQAPPSGFRVEPWIVLVCALAMGLGTMSGGWKIMRTIGSKMIKIQPIHGFAAETTAALVIQVCSHAGIPLSTTHVITTSIMGVGATKRLSAVKWNVVQNIVVAWLLTIPATFTLAGLLVWLYEGLTGG
jgi:PiT family inorganic phosphate transporter